MYALTYLLEVGTLLDRMTLTNCLTAIDGAAAALTTVRESKGRLFIVGCGGGAAHASHAASDFRRLCELDAYCLTDNVAEFTAIANDVSWVRALASMLIERNVGQPDALLVLSVGGGKGKVSPNLTMALQAAKDAGAATIAIVGKPDGFAAMHADVPIIIPATDYPQNVTAYTESIQSVVLHLLATHPMLARHKPLWESQEAGK